MKFKVSCEDKKEDMNMKRKLMTLVALAGLIAVSGGGLREAGKKRDGGCLRGAWHFRV